MDEEILVFPADLLEKIGTFQGLAYDYQRYFDEIRENFEFLPRSAVEKDLSYKQLIPYAIFLFSNSVFSYKRGAFLGEKRLVNRYSIGIGGHISTTNPSTFDKEYKGALEREINEELVIN